MALKIIQHRFSKPINILKVFPLSHMAASGKQPAEDKVSLNGNEPEV